LGASPTFGAASRFLRFKGSREKGVFSMAIDKAKIYNTWLDEVYNANSTTMDWENNPNIRITGGNSVSIPTITTSGNRTYDRSNGFARSTGNLAWKDYTFDYDRSFEYLVDAMDQDETNNVYTVTAVLDNHVKNQEVPETDSIRYAKVFQSIVDDSDVKYGYYAPVAATVYSQFMTNVTSIRKVKGHVPLRAKMSESAFGVLSSSTELSKQMMVQVPSGTNEVNVESYKINGVEIDVVPDDRMVTEIALLEPGYSIKAWAQYMNWVIYAPGAIVAAKKRNNTKQFPNGSHTEGDGDLIQGRMYHGVWTLEHQKEMIYISLKTATIAGFSAAELLTTGATNITYTIATYATRDTGHKFYYFDGGSAAAKTVPACYDEFSLTGYVEITAADAVADVVTSGYYGTVVELDENGRVIRFGSIKASA
jgi:hypothetical protein